MKSTFFTIVNNLKWNAITIIKSFAYHRDKRVWLFGSWMGERFADNSRFLFQYLSDNKDKYGLKEVVWVSRKQDVVDSINSMGYKAYLCDSNEGIYYHYKAGVHIICNSNIMDIDTKRSFGAVKIQLWHGNGIKASNKMTRKKESTVKERIWDEWIKPLIIPGRWFYAYWVACSKESKRVLVNDSGALPKRVIIANSPRLCQCISFLPGEISIINQIKEKRKLGWTIIMYLPTFRKSDSGYIAPLEIPGFIEYLKTRKIIWIQKNHSADKRDSVKSTNSAYVVNLDSDFDVNVLYDYLDIFISDYSSATTDAIYKDVVTIDYCPDYDQFSMDDRGFVADYNKYHIGNFVSEPKKLEEMIDKCIEKKSNDFINHDKVKRFLFNNNKAEYDTIVKSIIKTTKISL